MPLPFFIGDDGSDSDLLSVTSITLSIGISGDRSCAVGNGVSLEKLRCQLLDACRSVAATTQRKTVSATYVYPARDIDQASRLVPLLGSFWENTYEDRDSVAAIVYQIAQLDAQAEQNLRESIDTIGRFSLPVLHRDLWKQLKIRESALTKEETQIKYGDGYAYGDELNYGQLVSAVGFSCELDSSIKAISGVHERIYSPAVTWTAGLDFRVEPGKLTFRLNPFVGNFAVDNVYVDGQISDREVTVWLREVSTDLAYVEAHVGSVLGLSVTSAKNSLDFLNAIYDGVVTGGHELLMREAIAAVVDVPTVIEEFETVEGIATDSRYLLVLTDKNVYRFNPAALPTVSIGQRVCKGSELVDAVKFFDFRRGQVPRDIVSLTVDRGFIGGEYLDGLTFDNKSVPVLIVSSSDSLPALTFKIGGWPLDVDQFWQSVRDREEQANQSLAGLLNAQAKGTLTGIDRVPAYINPLEFLAANVLRDNVFAVRLKSQKFGDKRLPLQYLRALRRVIPPHTSLIVIFELDLGSDTIRPNFAGDTANAGCTESISSYVAGTTLSETVGSDQLRESSRLSYVTGICL